MLMYLVTDVHRCVQADGKALIGPLRAGEGGNPCARTDHFQLLLCARSEARSFIQHLTVFPRGLYAPDSTVGTVHSLVRLMDMGPHPRDTVPTSKQDWE